MKKMSRNEIIAVAVTIVVIGYFFGSFFLGGLRGDTVDVSNEPVVSGDTSSTPSGDLIVTDTVVGAGAEATPGRTLVVHYTGMFLDGTKFDSSLDRGVPFEFTLGAGQVIAGWDQGFTGMKVGGKRRLVVPPLLAYGETGAPPIIPGNATLVFDVELLEVK